MSDESGVDTLRFRFDHYRIPATAGRDALGHKARGQGQVIGQQWGSIKQFAGRLAAKETENSGRLRATATYVITVNFAREIDPTTDYFVGVAPSSVAGKVYQIEAANNVDGMNRQYLLTCIEVKNPPQ